MSCLPLPKFPRRCKTGRRKRQGPVPTTMTRSVRALRPGSSFTQASSSAFRCERAGLEGKGSGSRISRDMFQHTGSGNRSPSSAANIRFTCCFFDTEREAAGLSHATKLLVYCRAQHPRLKVPNIDVIVVFRKRGKNVVAVGSEWRPRFFWCPNARFSNKGFFEIR